MSLSQSPLYWRNLNNNNYPLEDPSLDNNFVPILDPDAPLKTLKSINDMEPLSLWYRIDRWLEGQHLTKYDNNAN
ncbi:hypothetical protein GCK72_025046 [Caenorhabditis remanei]|uniref:Uncharacterized protein n=1 Tax=Caenorhabditis remanei TaxID=31234 RepID=A0A6A5G224_CAERE|nr:hypothetical protein GCK72_025046 [Caenorhabditis remanei]KAF1748579.1 hypothetical protein GCK72_025046 [Caenorhabditis remanei]